MQSISCHFPYPLPCAKSSNTFLPTLPTLIKPLVLACTHSRFRVPSHHTSLSSIQIDLVLFEQILTLFLHHDDYTTETPALSSEDTAVGFVSFRASKSSCRDPNIYQARRELEDTHHSPRRLPRLPFQALSHPYEPLVRRSSYLKTIHLSRQQTSTNICCLLRLYIHNSIYELDF